jgi:beta-fructofuranosidase
MGSPPRARPTVHFAAADGWINDPHGIYWDGRRYQLYFQAVPQRTTWAPDCRWGHASSDDLLTWREHPLALVPQEWETGCWSGCVVSDAPGATQAFYTRVGSEDLDLGEIALALPDETGGFVSSAEDVVLRPPHDPTVRVFRDPVVRRHSGGWQMIVGGGRADGTGCVFDYRSADLRAWASHGELCSGRILPPTPGSGEAWECPQLVRIGDRDVLVVSVQVDGAAGPVVAAVSDTRGTFDEPRWQPFAYGAIAYATSAFRDRDGRACVTSWLRERPDWADASAWAGAESLPAVLGLSPSGDAIVEPHPAVLASDMIAHLEARAVSVVDVQALSGAARCSVRPGEPIDLFVRGLRGDVLRVVGDGADVTVVDPLTGAETQLPRRAEGLGVDVLVDADIVEVYAGGSYGVWRLAP